MASSSNCASAESDENMVKEIIKNILILDYSKKPFKYSDIVSNINPKPTRKKWAQLFIEVKNSLTAMGLIIHKTKRSSNNMYFITNQTKPLPMMYKCASDEEVSDRILLTLILAFIFMKNGTVFSDRLLNHLEHLGIYSEAKAIHPYFGNVKKKVFTEFPEKLYLSLTNVADNADLFEIKWGERAEFEVSKKFILDFICKYGFRGSVKPQEYPSHYAQVLIQEGRETLGRTSEISAADDSASSDDDGPTQQEKP